MVRAAARERGAQFHTTAIDPGSGDEDTLRRRRHEALEAIAGRTACRWILLGHTSDDQIETIVFRFLRGAGFRGLSGMRENRPPLVRPLLSMRREELRRMLRARGVAWAEDATNLSDRYARGRLRTHVLPAIAAMFGRGALDHLLDVAPRWRADEDYLERETARLLAYASRRGTGGVELDVTALAEADPALRARALRTWLAGRTGKHPGSRELAVVERWLDQSAAGDSGVDVAGARVTRARGRLAARSSDASADAASASDSASNASCLHGHSVIDIPASSDDALRSEEEEGESAGRQRS
jgi:tRNA(Ile)-lysidine synthase